MTPRDFCYWLQGHFELNPNTPMTPYQTEMVKRHLSMVFRHEIDPSFPADQQDDLNKLHQGVALDSTTSCSSATSQSTLSSPPKPTVPLGESMEEWSPFGNDIQVRC